MILKFRGVSPKRYDDLVQWIRDLRGDGGTADFRGVQEARAHFRAYDPDHYDGDFPVECVIVTCEGKFTTRQESEESHILSHSGEVTVWIREIFCLYRGKVRSFDNVHFTGQLQTPTWLVLKVFELLGVFHSGELITD